jgi:hypothetical protein
MASSGFAPNNLRRTTLNSATWNIQNDSSTSETPSEDTTEDLRVHFYKNVNLTGAIFDRDDVFGKRLYWEQGSHS